MNYRHKPRLLLLLVAGILYCITYKLFSDILGMTELGHYFRVSRNPTGNFYSSRSSKHFLLNNTLFLIAEMAALSQNINLNRFAGERIIHLDLKGAPPSVRYFMELFPLLRSLNVTGLLIEYEDMFPYSQKFTHAANTYSKKDIQLLLKTAKQNELSVIPLVQTFGHLEFVLKVKKFSHLREVFKYPQVIINFLLSILNGVIVFAP